MENENGLLTWSIQIIVPYTAQEVFFSLCNPIMDKRDKNMSTYHNILG